MTSGAGICPCLTMLRGEKMWNAMPDRCVALLRLAMNCAPLGQKVGGVAMVTINPVTAERWDDLARVFGPNGARGSCWCVEWRL